MALWSSYQSQACDVCGCSINTGGGEVIPGMFQHYVGLRSNIRSFSSEHLTLFDDEPTLYTKEWFHTSEAHFRYSPTRRVQLFGFMPYNSVWKQEEGTVYQSQGIGDFRVRANVVVVDQKEEETNATLMNLFLGASLKMPTGRSEYLSAGESAIFHRNMLPGTGSWDAAIHADFVYGKKDVGGMASATYMFRGTNDYQYQFGNLMAGQLTAFYKHRMNGSSLLFELGLNLVHMNPDMDLRWNEAQVYSQGTMVAPLVRAAYFRGNWMVQASANKAAWQDMAQGYVTHNYHLELGLTYFITSKKSAK